MPSEIPCYTIDILFKRAQIRIIFHRYFRHYLICFLPHVREIAEEKRQARINLVPVLQAEEDARWVKDTADKFVPQVYIGAWMPPAVNNPFMGVRPDNYK